MQDRIHLFYLLGYFVESLCLFQGFPGVAVTEFFPVFYRFGSLDNKRGVFGYQVNLFNVVVRRKIYFAGRITNKNKEKYSGGPTCFFMIAEAGLENCFSPGNEGIGSCTLFSLFSSSFILFKAKNQVGKITQKRVHLYAFILILYK